VKLGRLLERRLNRGSAGPGLTASQPLVLSFITRRPGSEQGGRGWRSVFVLSVPVAALAALVSRGDRPGQRARATDPLDPLGQLLLASSRIHAPHD
jgi:hypothetical protein